MKEKDIKNISLMGLLHSGCRRTFIFKSNDDILEDLCYSFKEYFKDKLTFKEMEKIKEFLKDRCYNIESYEILFTFNEESLGNLLLLKNMDYHVGKTCKTEMEDTPFILYRQGVHPGVVIDKTYNRNEYKQLKREYIVKEPKVTNNTKNVIFIEGYRKVGMVNESHEQTLTIVIHYPYTKEELDYVLS